MEDATRRMRLSLEDLGATGLVTILTKAAVAGRGSGQTVHPNFSPGPGEFSEVSLESGQRLRTVSEMLDSWLPPGTHLDFMRVKVGQHSAAHVFRGLLPHLSAGRIRRLMVSPESVPLYEQI